MTQIGRNEIITEIVAIRERMKAIRVSAGAITYTVDNGDLRSRSLDELTHILAVLTGSLADLEDENGITPFSVIPGSRLN